MLSRLWVVLLVARNPDSTQSDIHTCKQASDVKLSACILNTRYMAADTCRNNSLSAPLPEELLANECLHMPVHAEADMKVAYVRGLN